MTPTDDTRLAEVHPALQPPAAVAAAAVRVAHHSTEELQAVVGMPPPLVVGHMDHRTLEVPVQPDTVRMPAVDTD